MKRHLEKIQYSDNEYKKKWLIGLSAAAMVLIIIFWFMYINAFVIKSAGTDDKIEGADVGFWQVFKSGLSITGGNIAEKIKSGISKIFDKVPAVGGKNSMSIENPDIQK